MFFSAGSCSKQRHPSSRDCRPAKPRWTQAAEPESGHAARFALLDSITPTCRQKYHAHCPRTCPVHSLPFTSSVGRNLPLPTEATHPAPPASLPDQVPPPESSRNLPAGLLTRIPERMYTIRRPRRPCVRRHGAARYVGRCPCSLFDNSTYSPAQPTMALRALIPCALVGCPSGILRNRSAYPSGNFNT